NSAAREVTSNGINCPNVFRVTAKFRQEDLTIVCERSILRLISHARDPRAKRHLFLSHKSLFSGEIWPRICDLVEMPKVGGQCPARLTANIRSERTRLGF